MPGEHAEFPVCMIKCTIKNQYHMLMSAQESSAYQIVDGAGDWGLLVSSWEEYKPR